MTPELQALLREEPYTPAEIRQAVDSDNWIRGVVRVDLSDIIGRDFEGFLDMISEKLVGSDLLSDVSYDVVGFEGGDTLFLKVEGNAEMVLETTEGS